MHYQLPARFGIFLLWFVLTAVSLKVRPLFPVDETRYVSVAWEMWLRQDYLVPHLNGETYSHKPPLLFWLINLLWMIFGVNETVIRWIGPLFSLAGLFLTGKIAGLLWPEKKQIDTQVQFILLGFFFWMLYGTLTMFDMMLAFFVLLGIYSQIKLAICGLTWQRWGLFSLAIGGGVLTKGPVILLHLLPAALLLPWWQPKDGRTFALSRWYLGLFLSVLAGAAIALCWAIPAGLSGGEAYRNAIFLGQTQGRIVNSFAHRLPWWWYVQKLPVLLLPWLLWPAVWRAMKNIRLDNQGTRFCLVWAIPVFVAFSLISGKRIHYLLPLMPAFALLIAYALSSLVEKQQTVHTWLPGVIYALFGIVLCILPWLNDSWQIKAELSDVSPVWGGLLLLFSGLLFLKPRYLQQAVFNICVVSVAAFLVLEAALFSVFSYRYDMQPAALHIQQLRARNKAVAFYTAKYHGQYNFVGRFKKPLTVLKQQTDLKQWMAQHADGYVIKIIKVEQLNKGFMPYPHFPFKGKEVVFLPVSDLKTHAEWLQ